MIKLNKKGTSITLKNKNTSIIRSSPVRNLENQASILSNKRADSKDNLALNMTDFTKSKRSLIYNDGQIEILKNDYAKEVAGYVS